MSTNGMESWAVDLKDVSAIYPFQGTEVILVILGDCVLDRVSCAAGTGRSRRTG